jgi:flagellar FliJ protein
VAFKFRLQKVLDLRAEKEQDAATQLARSRQLAENARAEKSALESSLSEGFAGIATAAGRTVGEMRSRAYALALLDQRIAQAEQAIVRAEAEVAQRTAEYSLAFRDRRILDRLKDKHLEEWRAEETRTDLMTMDGIALGRFVTNGRAAPAKEE